jgi:hypothetical protein
MEISQCMQANSQTALMIRLAVEIVKHIYGLAFLVQIWGISCEYCANPKSARVDITVHP